jgi:hypothetical protein
MQLSPAARCAKPYRLHYRPLLLVLLLFSQCDKNIQPRPKYFLQLLQPPTSRTRRTVLVPQPLHSTTAAASFTSSATAALLTPPPVLLLLVLLLELALLALGPACYHHCCHCAFSSKAALREGWQQRWCYQGCISSMPLCLVCPHHCCYCTQYWCLAMRGAAAATSPWLFAASVTHRTVRCMGLLLLALSHKCCSYRCCLGGGVPAWRHCCQFNFANCSFLKQTCAP